MKKIILSVMTLSVILAAVSCKNDKDENFFSRTDQQLYIGDDIAIANTQYGKVRGYIMRHLHFPWYPLRSEHRG